jgi:hypothetical protein
MLFTEATTVSCPKVDAARSKINKLDHTIPREDWKNIFTLLFYELSIFWWVGRQSNLIRVGSQRLFIVENG